MKKIAIILVGVVLTSFAFAQDTSNKSLESIGQEFGKVLDSAVNEVKDFSKDVFAEVEEGFEKLLAPKSVKIDQILPVEVVRELRSTGSIKRFLYGEKDSRLKLYPDTPLGNQTANYWQRENEPVFLVESLYLLDKNNSLEWDTVGKIATILTNLSEMEGMQYYSNSQEKWDTLYTDVYTVNNPEERKEIPDPGPKNINGLKSYVYQKDRSLSGTVYQFDYFKNNYEVGFRGINTEKMHYKVMNITVVHPENLVITLNATDVGEQVLFYLVVQADVPKIPFVSKKLATSFSSRADAIYQWCVDMYRKQDD